MSQNESSSSSELLFQLCDKYDVTTVIRVFRDIVDFLLERNLLTEFRLWKRQRRIMMSSDVTKIQ